jgi:hypothetical protein
MYTQILNAAVVVDGVINEERQYHIKNLTGIIIVLQCPLPSQSIAALLSSLNHGYNKVELRNHLGCLASVIPITETETNLIEIFHPSFANYMQDPRQCKNLHLTHSVKLYGPGDIGPSRAEGSKAPAGVSVSLYKWWMNTT